MPRILAATQELPPSKQIKSDELVTLYLVLRWGLGGCSSPGLLWAEITLAPHPTMLSSLRVFPSILVGYTLGSKSIKGSLLSQPETVSVTTLRG